MDTAYSMMKWIGAFAMGVMVTVIVTGFTVSRYAGRVEVSVEHLQEVIQKQELANREIEKISLACKR